MATKYENYDCGDSGHGYFSHSTYAHAQTFTPDTHHTCTHVALRLWKRGIPPTTYTVGVFTTSGGLPTGNLVVSATLDGTEITDVSGGEMKLVALDNSTNLASGTVYAVGIVAPAEGDTNNCLVWLFGGWGNGNPYADGQACKSIGAGWEAEAGYDFGFEEWGDTTGVQAPTVTTQACTDIAPESLTGNGVVTSLGSATVTQHGHCWNTTQNPTTADTKTTLGTAYQTGHFTSAITPLTAGVTYYFKAYATNSWGTAYGSQVSNTMATAIGRRHWWVEGTDFHWFGQDGVEYKASGIGINSADIPWPF